jgi:hypothetical protein
VDTMKKIEGLAEEQAAAEAEVERIETELTRAKAALRDVQEHRLPEAMEEVGLTEFKTEGGLKIKVTKKVRTSINERNRAAAMAWLREHGHSTLIKRSLTVLAADDAQGDELVKMLDDYDVSDKATVPWQTLDRFVREMLEDGEDIPQETFGVYHQQKAKVTR